LNGRYFIGRSQENPITIEVAAVEMMALFLKPPQTSGLLRGLQDANIFRNI
jgi:hypothetical protein